MSAFCVFGITALSAREAAEEYTPYTSANGRKLYAAKRQALIEEKTQNILQFAKPRQISPAFDTPHFAEEWLRLARASTEVRAARVMVRAEKVNDDGTCRISKRTGMPLIAWIPYRERKKA